MIYRLYTIRCWKSRTSGEGGGFENSDKAGQGEGGGLKIRDFGGRPK